MIDQTNIFIPIDIFRPFFFFKFEKTDSVDGFRRFATNRSAKLKKRIRSNSRYRNPSALRYGYAPADLLADWCSFRRRTLLRIRYLLFTDQKVAK